MSTECLDRIVIILNTSPRSRPKKGTKVQPVQVSQAIADVVLGVQTGSVLPVGFLRSCNKGTRDVFEQIMGVPWTPNKERNKRIIALR